MVNSVCVAKFYVIPLLPSFFKSISCYIFYISFFQDVGGVVLYARNYSVLENYKLNKWMKLITKKD